MSTSLPSAASHICAIWRPIARNFSSYFRESGVFQPKCQTAVCAPVSSFCGGALTFLETASEPGARAFRQLPADGFELYLDERLREPEELELAVGGLRRKHVHAYWEGCAYVV